MKTTDWKYDFSSLPRWNIRNTIPFVYDEFFEIPQSDMLCCIYSVAEVSMCNYLGELAILKNKDKPELLLNITEGISFYPNFSVSSDGNLIFLQPCIYYQQNSSVKIPILIIDLSQNTFSYLVTDNANPSYRIVELKPNVFGIEADDHQKNADKSLRSLSRKKIRINRLKWYDISMLNALPEMISCQNHPSV